MAQARSQMEQMYQDRYRGEVVWSLVDPWLDASSEVREELRASTPMRAIDSLIAHGLEFGEMSWIMDVSDAAVGVMDRISLHEAFEKIRQMRLQEGEI